MRFLLNASTALTAVGLIAAGATSAGAAEKVQMGIGGYFGAFFAIGSQDDGTGEPGANLRNNKVAREAEIHFKGSTTLDNGLKVGVQVELEAETCGDQIDESYIWFDGAYGKLLIGSTNGAPYKMAVTAPGQLAMFGPSDPRMRILSIPADTFGGNGATTPMTHIGTFTSGDSEKLTYISPRISGFSFGVSYTPEPCEEVGGTCTGSYGGFQVDNNANTFAEIVEGAIRYDGKFDGVGVEAMGGITRGSNEAQTAGFRDDRTEYGFGARVSYMGWRVGASYRHDDQGISGGNNDRRDYAFGITYDIGPWGVGLNHERIDFEDGAAGGKDRLRRFQLEGTYALGPGIELQAGIIHDNYEDSTNLAANENQGTVFVIGTYITF